MATLGGPLRRPLVESWRKNPLVDPDSKGPKGGGRDPGGSWQGQEDDDVSLSLKTSQDE